MLSDVQRSVLRVESRFWHHVGAKEDAIREETGLTPTRYYQVLNALTADPEAWGCAPQALARTVRVRERQRR
jgi:hypothetical protein